MFTIILYFILIILIFVFSSNAFNVLIFNHVFFFKFSVLLTCYWFFWNKAEYKNLVWVIPTFCILLVFYYYFWNFMYLNVFNCLHFIQFIFVTYVCSFCTYFKSLLFDYENLFRLFFL